MSSSKITIDLQNKEKSAGLVGIDVINGISRCLSEDVEIGHYIVNLIVHGKVKFSSRQKLRLYNLIEKGIIHLSRKSAWNQVRAFVRMLDKLESDVYI